MKRIAWSCCIALLAGCVVETDASISGAARATALPFDPPEPEPEAEPQLPDVDGDVIGMPGAEVPGMEAHYVWTGKGWLGEDGDVVFEAIIRLDRTQELACGIFRSDAQGEVNPIIFQDQAAPDTDGGIVRHPTLPVASRGETLVIAAEIVDGDIERALFSVPIEGGVPSLLLGTQTGVFKDALMLLDGTVVVEILHSDGSAIVAIFPDGATLLLCDRCLPGFSTDGKTVVVRDAETAWAVRLDGTRGKILSLGDAAPGSNGSVTAILWAGVTDTGQPVVHARTDDQNRRDVLLRFSDAVEVLAACGAPAPGTTGVFAEIHPAAGRSKDVVFGALLQGDPQRQTAIFCANDTGTELLAGSGDPIEKMPASIAVSSRDIVASADGAAAFAGFVINKGLNIAAGVFVKEPTGGVERVVTTNARLTAIPEGRITGFLYPLRDAMDITGQGRVLVHVGIELDRQPGARYGALVVTR